MLDGRAASRDKSPMNVGGRVTCGSAACAATAVVRSVVVECDQGMQELFLTYSRRSNGCFRDRADVSRKSACGAIIHVMR